MKNPFQLTDRQTLLRRFNSRQTSVTAVTFQRLRCHYLQINSIDWRLCWCPMKSFEASVLTVFGCDRLLPRVAAGGKRLRYVDPTEPRTYVALSDQIYVHRDGARMRSVHVGRSLHHSPRHSPLGRNSPQPVHQQRQPTNQLINLFVQQRNCRWHSEYDSQLLNKTYEAHKEHLQS